VTAPDWMAAPPRRRAARNGLRRQSAPTPGIAAVRVVTSERGVGTPVDLAALSESKVSDAGRPRHVLIMKTIFSKLCRQEKCGQRHNWRGKPVIGQNTLVRTPEGGREAAVWTAPGASTVSLCNANFSKLS
jgi:hypothetical protein